MVIVKNLLQWIVATAGNIQNNDEVTAWRMAHVRMRHPGESEIWWQSQSLWSGVSYEKSLGVLETPMPQS